MGNLELKPGGQLHLPLAEKEAICAGNRTECRVEDQVSGVGRDTGGGDGVDSVVHRGNLSVVEDIESFSQQLQLGALAETEATRDAQVGVLDRRLLEEVARQECKTQGSIRAIDAARLAEAEGSTGAARKIRGVARAGESVEDG